MAPRKQTLKKASAPLPDARTDQKQPLRRSKRVQHLLRSKKEQKKPDTNQPAKITTHQNKAPQKRTQQEAPLHDRPYKRPKTAPQYDNAPRSKSKPGKVKNPPRSARGPKAGKAKAPPRLSGLSPELQAVGSTFVGAPELIEYWRDHNEWPEDIFQPEEGDDAMPPSKNLRPRKPRPGDLLKQAVRGRRKQNDEMSGISGASGPSGTSGKSGVSGESGMSGKTGKTNSSQRSSKYIYTNHTTFRALLAKGGEGIHHMMQEYGAELLEEGVGGPSDASKKKIRKFERSKGIPPDDIRYINEKGFKAQLLGIAGHNEGEVKSVIGGLFCPSTGDLLNFNFRQGQSKQASYYSKLEGRCDDLWKNQPPVIPNLPKPKPDYCVGYSSSAFSKSQIARMDKATTKSRTKPTDTMYFPFFTAEAKCFGGSIEVADNQNAHSMMLSIYILVDLFKGAHLEHFINGEILGFSLSYKHDTAVLHGHYPVLNEDGDVYVYQTEVQRTTVTPKDMSNRWQSWKFVRNIYEKWSPEHLERICKAIDNLDESWGVPPPSPPPPPR